jgi:zinc D-Ala-D-Ala dipeptidase
VKLAVVAAALAACSHGPPAAPEPPPSTPLPFVIPPSLVWGSSDLVVAIADDWRSTTVTITHWQGEGAGWRRVGDPWPGVVGGGGLAWGDGLHGTGAPAGHGGPLKHEGDSASPAGMFRIAEAFGFDGPGYKLTEATQCVDDPSSTAYNRIVERTGSADWKSSEHMRSVPQYEIGAVIDHNPARTPGDGSCIFLHVWAGPDSTTVGCTAMDHDKLADLLHSLGKRPVFVLLPRAEYEALRKPWGLPAQ